MGTAVLLRGDFNGASLRALAKKSRDGNRTRRLVAIAEIYDGGSRSDAARIGGVGLQTIRDWVLRFNARGPDGLVDGKAPGQRSKLGDDHRHVLAAMVEAGPNQRSMAWFGGGLSISRSGFSRSTVSRSRNRS